MKHARPSDIFEELEQEMQDNIDGLVDEIVNIDIDDIDIKSKSEAAELIHNLSKLYMNEEFLKSQPGFKKRVDAELESLRINYKMRKSDEIAHDILLKKICQNSDNASMYKALTEMQKTILSITAKIDETITRLNNMLKNYQLEINFDQPEPQSSDDNQDDNQHRTTYKGSKAYIEAMEGRIDDIDVPEDDDD